MHQMPFSIEKDTQAQRGFKITKKPIFILGIFLLFLYGLSLVIIHKNIDTFIIGEKLEDLNRHILYQKALHRYIEDTEKPVFYELQAKNILSQDFFDARSLSFTFIARHVFQNFQQILQENKLPNWQYRLISDNARNPINDGSAQELAILKRFNENPELTKIEEIVKHNQQTYLSVSLPVGPNKASCLRCHGKPEDAPAQMRASYSEDRGFFESIGHIRGYISYQVQLDQALQQGHNFFVTVAVILLSFFSIIFAAISWFYIQEQQKQYLINTQRKQLNFLAHHDSLTQLLNRYSLDQRLPEMLEAQAQVQNSQQKTLWVIMFDIDHFKLINDQYGHDVGDQVLKQVAFSLQQLANQWGPENATFRMGGEEFVILLPDSRLTQVTELYQAIQVDIKNHLAEKQTELFISAGATQYQKGDSRSDILKRADKALYQAKQNGRNQLIIYQD